MKLAKRPSAKYLTKIMPNVSNYRELFNHSKANDADPPRFDKSKKKPTTPLANSPQLALKQQKETRHMHKNTQ
jgi:hypothetical protein